MKKLFIKTIYPIFLILIAVSFAYGGATFSRIKSWSTGESLTASQLNAEFNNILNNLDPTGIDDESANDAAAQATSDPYPSSSLSKAASLKTEIQQLRYQLAAITGETYWYIDPDWSLSDYTTAELDILDGLTATTAEINAHCDGTTIRGITRRAQFAYKDADEIYINGGVYTVNDKIAFSNSQLTSDIGSPDASDWYYLYLDESEISASGVINADAFVWSNTEPTWSNPHKGWYNGNDRCIFAVLTDGSSNITEFYHDGDLVVFADYIEDYALAFPDTDWSTNVTLTIPKFAQKALVTFRMVYDALGVGGMWRTDGQTGTTGHYYGSIGTNGRSVNTIPVIASTSQIIEIKHTAGASDTTQILTDGWYFPIGI